MVGESGGGMSTEEEDAEPVVLDSFSNFSCTWNAMSSSRFLKYGYIHGESVSVLEEICSRSISIER